MFEQSKRYGILGMARSGVAAAYKIKELSGNAFLSDSKPESEISNANQIKRDFRCEFGGHTDKLFECDEWIVSPGIPLDIEVIQKAKAKGINLISEIEFGYQIKSPKSKIIAVTGSNGKSTTSSITAQILQQQGYNCILAGNIGDAFCSFPIHKTDYDYIVLEISSFQLDLITTFKPDVAVLLNITPDHLNRYDSFSSYVDSKFRIFANQTESDHAILFAEDNHIVNNLKKVRSQKHFFAIDANASSNINLSAWLDDCFITFCTGEKISVHSIQLKGPHNYCNVMASILAARAIDGSATELFPHVQTFKSLKHRLEFVATINGISFYNDSKATNTDSVKYALLSFDRPIRIIMGGSDKGEDFSILTDILKDKAKKVYITGDTSDKMRQTWLGKLPITCIDDFEECVVTAFEDSMAGDIIVLSPACASFDKFRNFEHRGETFCNIVNKLQTENEK